MSTALDTRRQRTLEGRILRPLALLRARYRLYALAAGVVQLFIALIVAGLAQLLIDRTLRLSVDQRAALNLLITFIWLWLIYRRILVPCLAPLSDATLARLVDRRYPDLHDQISSAVQFASGEVGDAASNSPALVREVMQDACAAAKRVSFLHVLNHRRARLRGVELIGLVGLVGLAWGIMPDTMSTWFQRNWLVQNIPWPQQSYIQPVGFDADGQWRVPRGDELVIRAQIVGRPLTAANLTWRTPSGRKGREAVTFVGDDALRVSLGPLTEDVIFSIHGGDEDTRDYTVVAVDRPRLVNTRATIAPPAYTGLPPFTVEQETVLETPDGSTVTIEAVANKPLRAARFVGGRDVLLDAEIRDERTIRLRWDSPQSGLYHFQLEDIDGWDNLAPVQFTLRVRPDEPPRVRLALDGVGELITPSAVLEGAVEASDAYGLAAVRMLVQRDDDPPRELPLPVLPRASREYRARPDVAVETLDLRPGQRLRVWAVAADIAPARPSETQTEPVRLRVVSADQFLTEMAQREMALRREFERLLSAQRGLQDALERSLADAPLGARPPSDVAQRLAGLARRQDSQADRCLAVQRGFAAILAELRTNRVLRATDERRLSERVIAPLAALAADQMPQAAQAIADLQTFGSPGGIETARAAQIELLREMERILSEMVEWEGYREAVTLLQQVIGAQQEVRDGTLEALEAELKDILELEDLGIEELPASAPATPGEPGARP